MLLSEFMLAVTWFAELNWNTVLLCPTSDAPREVPGQSHQVHVIKILVGAVE
jgi:hypothetical protein